MQVQDFLQLSHQMILLDSTISKEIFTIFKNRFRKPEDIEDLRGLNIDTALNSLTLLSSMKELSTDEDEQLEAVMSKLCETLLENYGGTEIFEEKLDDFAKDPKNQRALEILQKFQENTKNSAY